MERALFRVAATGLAVIVGTFLVVMGAILAFWSLPLAVR